MVGAIQTELWPRLPEIKKEIILYDGATMDLPITLGNYYNFIKQIKNETWPEDRADKDVKEMQ